MKQEQLFGEGEYLKLTRELLLTTINITNKSNTVKSSCKKWLWWYHYDEYLMLTYWKVYQVLHRN